MSISSDLSTSTLIAVPSSQAVQQESIQARQNDAKVVVPVVDTNSSSGSLKEHGKDIARLEVTQESTNEANVEDVNIKMRQLSVGLSFEKSEDGEESVVKVIDQDTGELVRQIPSEEFIEMSKRLDEIFGELKDFKGSLINSEA
ncbi:flagellar protein FlaG [Marinomonas gallaica]|uniref:flagellar protein FlaG n=1 Tax=Marinomonas gallaica TaxID=1806667 RepID=UPI003CE5443C